ncbi:MAG: zinc-dependent metalloprotease [Wenzhouxiangella sp.]
MPRFASLVHASLLAVFLLLCAPSVAADRPLLPLHFDPTEGNVLLEIRAPGQPLIYASSLATGLGATSPLIDRADTGQSALVVFERQGSRVLLIRENPAFQALSGTEALVRSVRESFPRSVLASFPIKEERDGVLLVDATEFFLSDVHGIAASLRQADLGTPTLDRERSYVLAGRTAAFSQNTEVRVALTFAVDQPGNTLRRHAPDGRSVTFEQQHSFMALPDDAYRPRRFHPRAGVFPHVVFDFSQAHDQDYQRRWIWRWRLIPSDPEAYLAGELVDPVEPIVFYLDPAIPEPYRSAFREGGMWWAEAFEAAGFSNAFQIRDLPADADPMDIRYSMLMWVHRTERGPSVGPHYRDPRTGEIVSALVRMDSFRSLVNHDLWKGFLPAAGPDGLAVDSEEMAMARRRQHTAHEIGHSLGLAHNFLAATRDRASVMDYPVPLVTLGPDGYVDLSAAYADGIGEADKLAIRYAYTWYPDEEAERAGLASIIDEFEERDLQFITGGHARITGSHPDATQWVEGPDMLQALERTSAVRRVLVDSFDERALAADEPYVVLHRRFAHAWLHHRTALYGVAKHIGGMEFSYGLKGDQVTPTRPIDPSLQRQALDAVLAALSPEELRIPDRVSALLAPPPMGWDSGWGWHTDAGTLESIADPVFDPIHTAHRLAFEIVGLVLDPGRLARSASFHARDPAFPGPDEVIGSMIEASWAQSASANSHEAALLRATQRSVLDGLIDLAGSVLAPADVRATADARLRTLAQTLGSDRNRQRTSAETAHRRLAVADIERYLAGDDEPAQRPRPEPIVLPWP